MTAPAPDQLTEAIRRGLALVRARRFAEAVPVLEPAAASGHFPYARMVLRFARFCAEERDLATVQHGGETFRFRISAANLGLDMFLVDGRFFEQDELDYCRARVAPGGTIVDVGANIGNHAVYFGRFLRPACLIPVEPNALAVRLLRENLALNAVAVDERGLGVAVGRTAGQVGLVLGGGMDLVVGRVEGTGEVPMVPLDDLLDRRVDFLKIDVEGMEIDVLAGASRILSQDRPLVFIEVQTLHYDQFRAFCREIGYVIEKTFPARGYANHFLRPI